VSETETEIVYPAENGDASFAFAEPEPAAAGSLLDRLRARRAEIAAEQTTELLVPGYGGLVALRVGPIDARTQSKIAHRVMQSKAPDREWNAAADVLIAATREVVVRGEVDDPWLSIDEEEPVGISNRLAEALGFAQEPTARGVLVALFGLAPSPESAITSVSADYGSWASGADEEVDDAFVGESQGARRS